MFKEKFSKLKKMCKNFFLYASTFLFGFAGLSIGTFSVLESVDTDEGIASRIENISNDLSKASSEILSIQKELEDRIKYIEELKKEAEIAENVISLSDEQVNAVQAKFHQELETSSSKGLIQSFLLSLFFFVLGFVIKPISKAFKRKFATTPEEDTSVSRDNKYSDEEIEQAIKLLNTINQNKGSHDE